MLRFRYPELYMYGMVREGPYCGSGVCPLFL